MEADYTESVELLRLDIEVELLVEEVEEEVEEEEGLVMVGWTEGRSLETFGALEEDFLPLLASQGWEATCSRLSLDRGSVSRQA